MQNPPVVLLVGRDNWQRDEALNLFLRKKFTQKQFEVLWEDPAGDYIYFLRELETKLRYLPKFIKKINLRTLQVIYGVFHPSYFDYLRGIKSGKLQTRIEILKKIIKQKNIAQRTTILARSSGARVSTLIADELGLKNVICMGYPFQHPKNGDEPERYEHLTSIQTPTLVLQGTKDEYGGVEILEKYKFSESVEIHFFDTCHGFKIEDVLADKIVELIINKIVKD